MPYIFLLLFFNYFLLFSLEKKNYYDMIFIPGGEYFSLLKDNNKNEYVNSFLIDKYPVTNKNFKKFIKLNSFWKKKNVKSIFADENYLIHWSENEFKKIKNNPVTYISWFAAETYCLFFNKRLPNLNEWEYVANSGKLSINEIFYSYYLNEILNWYISDQLNFGINFKTMKNNFFDVFGMHGLIWEWVFDFNSIILINTDAEGGDLEELLFCGGSSTEFINPFDYVSFMRFAFRNSLEAKYTLINLGFRCVKDV